MRVCSIITSFTSGGAETLVGNLATAFVAAGHDAAVLALSDAGQVGNDPGIERAMMARLRDVGVDAASLHLRQRKNVIAGAMALRRHLAQGGMPDVIHAHTAAALPHIALARPACPVILTHHNSRLSFPPWAYRVFDRVVDAYVAISGECERQTSRLAERPVLPIQNAASAEFMAAAPRARASRDPIVLAVGTVSAQKDYPTLIRAAGPLARRLGPRRSRILIAGGGAELPALQALAAEEGADDLVTLLGPRSDIPALMRSADVFANSSLWEGFSIAMIEAAMSGLPMVATKVPGNSEMVLPEVNGCLVPASDPAALADAIAGVLDDDRRYAALSQGALASAARFSIEQCAAAHLGLYDDAIGGRLPRAGGREETRARPARHGRGAIRA